MQVHREAAQPWLSHLFSYRVVSAYVQRTLLYKEAILFANKGVCNWPEDHGKDVGGWVDETHTRPFFLGLQNLTSK